MSGAIHGIAFLIVRTYIHTWLHVPQSVNCFQVLLDLFVLSWRTLPLSPFLLLYLTHQMCIMDQERNVKCNPHGTRFFVLATSCFSPNRAFSLVTKLNMPDECQIRINSGEKCTCNMTWWHWIKFNACALLFAIYSALTLIWHDHWCNNWKRIALKTPLLVHFRPGNESLFHHDSIQRCIMVEWGIVTL